MIIWGSFLRGHKTCLKARTDGFFLRSQNPGTVHKHNRETLSAPETRKQVCGIRYCNMQNFVILSEEMLRLCQKVKWQREHGYGIKLRSVPRNPISSCLQFWHFLIYCCNSSCDTTLRTDFKDTKHPSPSNSGATSGKNEAQVKDWAPRSTAPWGKDCNFCWVPYPNTFLLFPPHYQMPSTYLMQFLPLFLMIIAYII